MSGANGSLSWAVKESFLAYIHGLPDSEIKLLGDCESVNETYVFPSVSSRNGEHLFSGGVHFTGFAGMLDVRLVDPIIEGEGNQRTLTMLVGPPSIAARVAIAEIDNAEEPRAATTWTATPKLTFEGVRVFGDVYQVGTELAPVVIERRSP